jgi:hypothetical protein
MCFLPGSKSAGSPQVELDELSLLDAGIFAVSGVADMIWHILFGIEQNVEALLSPTHLGLATGLILCMSGPLRAAWRCPESMTRGWKALLPMLFSVTFILSVLSDLKNFGLYCVHCARG